MEITSPNISDSKISSSEKDNSTKKEEGKKKNIIDVNVPIDVGFAVKQFRGNRNSFFNML